jgi:hypothetical protein
MIVKLVVYSVVMTILSCSGNQGTHHQASELAGEDTLLTRCDSMRLMAERMFLTYGIEAEIADSCGTEEDYYRQVREMDSVMEQLERGPERVNTE